MVTLTDKHRSFFVNDKLEFALFFDPNIKDTEKIINDFLESKDWKWFKDFYNIKKIKKTEISKDLREVRITCK